MATAAPTLSPEEEAAARTDPMSGAVIGPASVPDAYTPPEKYKPTEQPADKTVDKAYTPPDKYKPVAAQTPPAEDKPVDKAYTPPDKYKPIVDQSVPPAPSAIGATGTPLGSGPNITNPIQAAQPTPPTPQPPHPQSQPLQSQSVSAAQADTPNVPPPAPPQAAGGVPTAEQLADMPQGATPAGPQTQQQAQQALVAAGHSPGAAQAIVAGQQPATISGNAPAPPKPVPPPPQKEQPAQAAVGTHTDAKGNIYNDQNQIIGTTDSSGHVWMGGPLQQPSAPATQPATGQTAKTAAPAAPTQAAQPESGIIGGNRIKGTSTIFGLNYDRSIDLDDNGKGIFGANTRNPGLKGVAVPVDVLTKTFGEFTSKNADGTYSLLKTPEAQKVIQAIKSAHVEVPDDQGNIHKYPIVDIQGSLAGHPGKVLDFTYGAVKDMGYTDNHKVSYQIIGGDGKPYPIPAEALAGGDGGDGGSKDGALDKIAFYPPIPTHPPSGSVRPTGEYQLPGPSGGGGGVASESTGTGGASLNLGNVGSALAGTGLGYILGGGGRRGPSPQSAPEEEDHPMVGALMDRGFSRQEALAYSQSMQTVSPGSGIGPLQRGEPPAAPTEGGKLTLLRAPTPQALPATPATPSTQLSLLHGPTQEPVSPIKLSPAKQVMPGKAPPKAPPKAAPPAPSGAPAQAKTKAPPPAAPAAAPAPVGTKAPTGQRPNQEIMDASVAALRGLGFDKTKARAMITAAPGSSVTELVTNALQAHGKGAVHGVEGKTFRPTEAPAAPAEEGEPAPSRREPSEPALYEGGAPPGEDTRVKKQADGKIKGEHFVEGDPDNDKWLEGLPGGKGGRDRGILARAEEAISDKKPMHISYISAPKEAEKFPTRESRTIQYDEHSPLARLKGTTTGQLVGHSFMPVAVGINAPKPGKPHEGKIHGISTNVMANNFEHINQKLAEMGRTTPYETLGTKFANDLEGYLSNLQAGHTGTGRGYATGTSDHPNEPDTSHVPYKLSRKEADFLNLVINNTAAFSKNEDAQKIRELARANGTLITEGGETNRLAHDIEQHQPGWTGRISGTTGRVIEPTIRTFDAGLVHEIHENEEHMPETIRPGKAYQDLTKAMERTTYRGRPDIPVAASLHHTFTDNKAINNIERAFSEHKIDEAEARKQLKSMGEDPDEYRFIGGSGGMITPYEDDPEAITPEEHTQMKNNLRTKWVNGGMGIDDYRKKTAEIPLPAKPTKPAVPSSSSALAGQQVPAATKPATPPAETDEPDEGSEPEAAPEAPQQSPAPSAAPSTPTVAKKPAAVPALTGKSKVVDEGGAPLTVHHGTGATIDKFDPKKTAAGTHWFTSDPQAADAYASRSAKEMMERGEETTKKINDYHLDLRNPIDMRQPITKPFLKKYHAAWNAERADRGVAPVGNDWIDRSFRDYQSHAARNQEKGLDDSMFHTRHVLSGGSRDLLPKVLQKMGHDGIYYHGKDPIKDAFTGEVYREPHDQWGAFKPEQIKKPGELETAKEPSEAPAAPSGAEFKPPAPKAASQYVSPNVKEGTTLAGAQKQVKSQEHKKARDFYQKVEDAYRPGGGGKVTPTIGNWEGTQEGSSLTHDDNDNLQDARTKAAVKGLYSAQKGTAAFHYHDDGPDLHYDIDFPEHPHEEADKLIAKHGFSASTIHQTPEGLRAHLIDPGGENHEHALQLAAEAKSKSPRVRQGTAAFDGADDRQGAAEEYRRILGESGVQVRGGQGSLPLRGHPGGGQHPLQPLYEEAEQNFGRLQQAVKPPPPTAPGEAAKPTSGALGERAPPPPGPGEPLPPLPAKKPKKGAKTKEQRELEAEDMRQAAIDRDNISPEDSGRLARIQKVAQGWIKNNPILHGLSMHAYLTGQNRFPGKLNKEGIGEHFDATNPKLDYSNEGHRQKAADAVVHDIMHSLAGTTTGKPSTAYGWYDRTIRKTMAKMGEIAPKILTDPAHALAFKLALAITSQGQDVFPNAESAWHIYQHWVGNGAKEGGMPVTRDVFGGGTKAEAMEANLAKVNELWEKYGTEGLHKILMKRMTSRKLKEKYGLDSGEKVDTVVNGAMGLGPKIGAFFSNLNGDFRPTTIDLWFSRNMNLMAGNMFGFSDKATREDRMEKGEVVKSHLSQLKDLLDSGELSNVPEAQAKAMAKELGALQKVPQGKLDRPTAKALAPEIYNWAREQHKTYQKSYGSKAEGEQEGSYHADFKTPENLTAKKLDEGVTGLSDDPRTTTERDHWRDIMARADSQLKAAKVHLTNADKQALLWFDVKDLFKMAGSPQKAKADYLDAAHRLVRKVKSGLLPGMPQLEAAA